MRIDSRERGQGITEYVLIIAAGLLIILGALYLFRNTIAGTTRQMTDAVSGEKAQSAVSDGDGSTAASDASQPQGDSDPQGGGDKPGSKEGDATEAGSSAEEAGEEGEETQARIADNKAGSSGGSARGDGAPRGTPRRITLVVLVVIAGVLVLIVGYFLIAASR